MGLEGIGGGGDDGGFLGAPALAQKMEDEGTNSENATILNLFLDSTTLAIGAPQPLTPFVGALDAPSSQIVFNANFTRERYGRAAVNDNVKLESDRRSLLLDGNMNNEGKARSILGALEFDNGLSAVQSMSAGDVTGTNTPINIDNFNRRPDAMYLNTGRLSGPKRDHLATAFTGNAEPEFVDAMVSQAGGDTTAFTTFGDVVADQPLMQSIAADSIAINMLSSHPNGAPAMVGSQTAMDEVAASQTALDSVASSSTANIAVAGSSTAVSAIETASTSGSNSVPITNSASIYVAELAGAGGGGGDRDFERNGDKGGDTIFNQSVGVGGDGGQGSPSISGDDGGANVSSPDVLINEIVGGGGNGGSGAGGGGNGGDGGFAKALICNPNRNTLSLSIGSGGIHAANAIDGEDGSATIFTPNAF
jgi:hypothetical protein